MSQQTNINTIGSNNNHNPYTKRGRGRDQRGCGGHGDYGNNISIANSLFQENCKTGVLT